VLGKGVSPVFVASDYLSAFVRLSCKARTFFICLYGGVVSSIDAVCSIQRQAVTAVECASLSIINFLLDRAGDVTTGQLLYQAATWETDALKSGNFSLHM